MARVTIALEAAEIEAALRRLLAAERDLTPLMRQIGDALVTSTRERFQASRAPGGRPRAPNSAVTLARFLGRYGGARRKDGRGLTRLGQAQPWAARTWRTPTRQPLTQRGRIATNTQPRCPRLGHL